MSRHLPQPDFLRPVARPGLLAWAWCTTGLLVLAATALDGQAVWQQRAQAQARLVRSAQMVVPAAARMAPADQLARQAEARRWLQQLAQPWPAVWAASETASAAAGGITWLALAHGGTAGLRLTGLSADLAPAQTAAKALREQQHQGRAVWQGVVLAAVERVPEGQRFELVASLADPAVEAGP